MQSIETALLYLDHPQPAFGQFEASLNAKLKPFKISFVAGQTDNPENTVFCGPGLRIVISARPQPLAADGFLHALDSPLSAPFQGVLSDALFRHQRHVLVSVHPSKTDTPVPAEAKLLALRVAHAACTLVAEWHQPVAVHWRQSNQLITGAQYMRLVGDTTPWALFAQARVFSGSVTPEGKRCHGLSLDDAGQFIGRPILFQASQTPIDQAYAAALSFLRHAVETGAPIPDGHTFGPTGGEAIAVKHCAATAALPQGRYELTALNMQVEDVYVGATGDRQSATPRMTVALPEPVNLAEAIDYERHQNRTRSLAISFLMLVILPPVGLLLLLSNLFLGADAGRTGWIASASVVFVLFIAGVTFLSYDGQKLATLDFASPISTVVLAD